MKRILPRLLMLAICAGGWGDDESTPPPPSDTTPPAANHDLRVTSQPGRVVTLRWAASGDDGAVGQAARYDIRYSRSTLNAASWDSATAVVSPPLPGPPGTLERLDLSNLPVGAWHFALKTADEGPNWSTMSNVVTAEVADLVPPGRITDLRVEEVTAREVRLAWTAPGGDGASGSAANYDLRWSEVRITEGNWTEATTVEEVGAPGTAGAAETFAVTDLAPGRNYHLAIRAGDESGNWSEISNGVEASTISYRRLTTDGASRPAWSPDGSRLAFIAAAASDRSEIFVIPAGGGTPIQITDHGVRRVNYSPSWSPDGSRIAYVSREFERGDPALMVVDAEPGAQPVRDYTAPRHIDSAAWTPHGTQIVFSQWEDPWPNSWLYLVPITGGDAHPVVDDPSKNYAPCWSPDGEWIAFFSSRASIGEVWMVRSTGEDAVRLTEGGAFAPAWSTQGDIIAVGSSRSGNPDIWTVRLSDGETKQLTVDPANDTQPTWAPDGKAIAFQSDRDGGVSDIWVLYLE